MMSCKKYIPCLALLLLFISCNPCPKKGWVAVDTNFSDFFSAEYSNKQEKRDIIFSNYIIDDEGKETCLKFGSIIISVRHKEFELGEKILLGCDGFDSKADFYIRGSDYVAGRWELYQNDPFENFIVFKSINERTGKAKGTFQLRMLKVYDETNSYPQILTLENGVFEAVDH